MVLVHKKQVKYINQVRVKELIESKASEDGITVQRWLPYIHSV